MSDLVHTCTCGQKTKISEYQLGMETACRNCKADVTYNLQNCEPLEPKAPPAPEKRPAQEMDTSFSAVAGDSASSATAAEPDDNHCTRCGKTFRGDWDRHNTIMGDICNICANRYAEDSLGTIGNPTESARTMAANAYGDDEEDPFRAMPRPEDNSSPRGPWFMEQYPVESKIVLSLLAAGVIILAIWASFQEPPSGEPMTDEQIAQFETEKAALEERLEGVPGIVVLLIRYGFSLVGLGLPMYIVLNVTNRTPYDSFIPNFIEVTLISGALAVIASLGLAGFVLSIIFTLMILWMRYDVPILYVLIYFIMSWLVAILIWAGQAITFGLIANAMR